MDTPLSILLKDKGHAIESILPSNTIYECSQKLNQLKVGALLVMENGNLIGIISERDVLRKIVAANKDPKTELVEAVMTKNLITVLPSTSVQEAMKTITEKRIRHLPVIDNGKLVGVISIGDLTRWVMLLQEQQISSLTSYIQGERG